MSKGICLTPYSYGVISQLALADPGCFQTEYACFWYLQGGFFATVGIHWLISQSAIALTLSPFSIGLGTRNKTELCWEKMWEEG